MKLTEFYDEVARRSDLVGTKINVAETKRVLATAFAVLAEQNAVDATSVISQGMKRAASKTKRK